MIWPKDIDSTCDVLICLFYLFRNRLCEQVI